jgi:selenophosphate synthetase-related protein
VEDVATKTLVVYAGVEAVVAVVLAVAAMGARAAKMVNALSVSCAARRGTR